MLGHKDIERHLSSSGDLEEIGHEGNLSANVAFDRLRGCAPASFFCNTTLVADGIGGPAANHDKICAVITFDRIPFDDRAEEFQ